jgi:uncharacterized protein
MIGLGLLLVVVAGVGNYIYERRCPHCGKMKLQQVSRLTYSEGRTDVTETTYVCQHCRQQVVRRRRQDRNNGLGGGGGIFIGGMGGLGGGRASGGSFGSFGGGSFGGGGAGGKF